MPRSLLFVITSKGITLWLSRGLAFKFRMWSQLAPLPQGVLVCPRTRPFPSRFYRSSSSVVLCFYVFSYIKVLYSSNFQSMLSLFKEKGDWMIKNVWDIPYSLSSFWQDTEYVSIFFFLIEHTGIETCRCVRHRILELTLSNNTSQPRFLNNACWHLVASVFNGEDSYTASKRTRNSLQLRVSHVRPLTCRGHTQVAC